MWHSDLVELDSWKFSEELGALPFGKDARREGLETVKEGQLGRFLASKRRSLVRLIHYLRRL